MENAISHRALFVGAAALSLWSSCAMAQATHVRMEWTGTSQIVGSQGAQYLPGSGLHTDNNTFVFDGYSDGVTDGTSPIVARYGLSSFTFTVNNRVILSQLSPGLAAFIQVENLEDYDGFGIFLKATGDLDPSVPAEIASLNVFYVLDNSTFSTNSLPQNSMFALQALQCLTDYRFGTATSASGGYVISSRYVDGPPTFALLQIEPATAIPEPASWAMMILGMGAVGGALRRRQKTTTRVAFAV